MILGKKIYKQFGYLSGIIRSLFGVFSLFSGKALTFFNARRLKRIQKNNLIEKGLGLPFLSVDSNQKLNCISCGLCEEICPTKCIDIQSVTKGQSIHAIPEQFSLNILECVYCSLCELTCPVGAIFMAKNKTIPNSLFYKNVWKIEDLTEWGKQAQQVENVKSGLI